MLLIVCRFLSSFLTVFYQKNTVTFVMFRKPTQEILQIISTNIRNYRLSQSLSQEEFAESSGLHRTYVGSIERCEKNLSLSTLEVLSKTLGVSVSQLLQPIEFKNDRQSD